MDVSGSIYKRTIIYQMIAFITDFYDNFNIDEDEENFIPISFSSFSSNVETVFDFNDFKNRSKREVIDRLSNIEFRN